MPDTFAALADAYPAWWVDLLGEHNHVGGAEATRWLLERSRLAPGEAIMMVATAAAHRGDAFAAAEYLMDYLKSRAPFWKKELGAGGEAWVAAKDADEDALKRW